MQYRYGPAASITTRRPKHASWLNMAEIEIGVPTRQCLDGRMPDLRTVTREVSTWQKRRNAARCTIEWSFARQDADRKMRRHYCATAVTLH